jgi:hypothetical protein
MICDDNRTNTSCVRWLPVRGVVHL